MVHKTKLTNFNDFWSLDYVIFKEGLWRVDLAKEPIKLNNGDSELQVPSSDLMYSILRVASQLSDKDLTKFLKELLSEGLRTNSKIRYSNNTKERISHDCGLQNFYGSFVGPDGYIKYKKTDAKSLCKAVLGTEDLKEINSVFKKVTGKDLYLLRYNDRPMVEEEHFIWFDAISARAILGCRWDPQFSAGALGVRKQKILE